MESKNEVAQDVNYTIWSKKTDLDKLWQAILKVHKVDCISNIGKGQGLIARKPVRISNKVHLSH